MTATAVAVAVPSAGRLRRELRRARRRHREGRLGDLYMWLLLILIYGGVIDRLLNRYLRGGTLLAAAGPAQWWLAVAVAVAVAGLAWRGARMLGPLLATPAQQAWCLSTPVARAGWLRGPLLARLAGGGLVGVGVGTACGVLAGTKHLAAPAAVGACGGVAVVGLAVLLQSRRLRRIHPLEWVPAAAGLAGAATILVLHAHAVALREPAIPGVLVVIVGIALAAALSVAGLGSLARLDRAALASGAQVAEATATATIFLDPTLLFGVLEARRWRALGRVRRRPFLTLWTRLPGRRWWLLLAADTRRLGRRPGSLAVWLALPVIPYAVALLAPPLAAPARLVCAYLATNRLTSGLRLIHAMPALRRALGGRDAVLRAVHLVLPALGLAVWWLLSSGIDRAPGYPAQLLFPVGIVVAVYRNAIRPPRSYGGGAVDTPFGLIPTDLLRQLVNGVDVLAILVLIQLAIR